MKGKDNKMIRSIKTYLAMWKKRIWTMNLSHVNLFYIEEELGLRPLDTYSANFANYNYGRGYHYFFNLDTFPRV